MESVEEYDYRSLSAKSFLIDLGILLFLTKHNCTSAFMSAAPTVAVLMLWCRVLGFVSACVCSFILQ